MKNSLNIGRAFKIDALPMVLLAFFCFTTQFTFGENIVVSPSSIQFNYESGNTSDALEIVDANGDAFFNPDWDDYLGSHNFAYIKGQSNRKVKVQFYSNYSGNMNLIIKLTVTSGVGIGTICNLFIPNYDGWERVLDLSGSVPNNIGKYTYTWKWEIYAMPTESSSYCAASTTTYTTHTYYTVFATPQAPLSVPWTSVLDKACVWASGQTSASGIAQSVVQNLYNNSGFLYDTYSGAPRYTGYDSYGFDLSQMLSEFGGSNIIVNCYDMGKAVNIFANALGCNSDYMFSSPFGFLNCIKPIGRSWCNNPFYTAYGAPYNVPIVGEDDSRRSQFGNHAFCMIGNDVYDACLKVDIDGNPDAAPHIESWASGWSWDTYKGKVIDDNPSSTPGAPSEFNFSVY